MGQSQGYYPFVLKGEASIRVGDERPLQVRTARMSERQHHARTRQCAPNLRARSQQSVLFAIAVMLPAPLVFIRAAC
jgi:hypothetical protein